MNYTACKDCTNRHLHCHSSCETYLAFKKAKDEENKKQRAWNEVTVYIRDTIERRKRRRHRG